MKIFTRNNVTYQGKQRVLLLTAEKEQISYCDAVIKDILALSNCAVFQFDPNEEIEIRDFSIGILIVSKNLLDDKNRIDFIRKNMMDNNQHIIPIAVESDVMGTFDNEFGSVHCIEKKENTEEYHNELRSYLEELLVQDPTLENIKDAFDHRIFLSYRKIDIEKTERVIRFLRQDKNLKEVAIWYDKYLVPGENYADEIKTEIENCDVFILIATKKLFENQGDILNYVERIEYPLAKKYNKTIIVINVDNVEEKTLYDHFDKINGIIKYGRKNELKKIFKSNFIAASNARDNDQYRRYLRGIAFMNGIFTEVDIKNGIRLMSSAASNGCKEALSELGNMYALGNRIDQNFPNASEYYLQLIDAVEKSGTVREFPHCYNNYAHALLQSEISNNKYFEAISVLDDGIANLKANNSEDREFTFYYALTLASYQKIISTALYDDVPLQQNYIQKQKNALKDSILICRKLLDEKYEDKIMGLLVTLEFEIAERKETVLEKERAYNIAINDQRMMYEKNPLVNEMNFLQQLSITSLLMMVDGNKDTVKKWVKEGLDLCNTITNEIYDEVKYKQIKIVRDRFVFVHEYLSYDFLFLLHKYNTYLQEDTNSDSELLGGLLALELEFIKRDQIIKNDVLREIKTTIQYLKNNGIRKENHYYYIMLSLEYEYKNIEYGGSINPFSYINDCKKLLAQSLFLWDLGFRS